MTNKVYIITGASRGIGACTAKHLAQKGAKVIIAAKTTEPHPKLEGTIFTVTQEIMAMGGEAFPYKVDIRNENEINDLVNAVIKKYGRIDGLINNASAISLTDTQTTDIKKLDLMLNINVRGTFLMTKAVIPYLLKSDNPHIINLSPPLNLNEEWLAPHVAYTLSKYDMTILANGWAAEFNGNIGVNTLWPKTTIATAAIENIVGGKEMMERSRKPTIMAEAIAHILEQDARIYTGNNLIDESVLRETGITDFDQYAYQGNQELQKDLFL